jgi:hypothetical protein
MTRPLLETAAFAFVIDRSISQERTIKFDPRCFR